MPVDKLIKISSTSKEEKWPVKSFEDTISFPKEKKKRKKKERKEGRKKERKENHPLEKRTLKN